MSVAYNFEGQVALVTGPVSGMGLDTAQAFARAGAAVTLADLRDEALGRAVEEIRSTGGKAIGVSQNLRISRCSTPSGSKAVILAGSVEHKIHSEN